MPSMAKRGLVRRTVRRLVKKLVGFFRGGAEVLREDYDTSDFGAYITTDSGAYQVIIE